MTVLARLLTERLIRVSRRGWRRLIPRSIEARRTARLAFGNAPMLAQDLFDGGLLFTVVVDGQRFSVLDKHGNVEARP